MIDQDFLIHDRHSYIVHGEDDHDWLVIVLGSICALILFFPFIIFWLIIMPFYKLYKHFTHQPFSDWPSKYDI